MRRIFAPKRTSWFKLALLGIFIVSAGLRFWGLGRFNTLVFDEVYFAKFANHYLTGTEFFDAHPPLGKYLIAIAIGLGRWLPFGTEATNALAGSVLSPWDYRWLNALTGSFLPLIVAGIAYQLSRRRSYAAIAAAFVALDGLFLVESRYALINVYLVGFGLLGHWFVLRALDSQGRSRWGQLAIAGMSFGASAAVKWNGLGFWLGIVLLWLVAWGLRGQSQGAQSFLARFARLHLGHVLLCLTIVPALTYSFIWIPHLHLQPERGFLEMQREILFYHQRIDTGADVHPYCSPWWSWPFLVRPVVYFFERTRESSATLPSLPPNLDTVVFDVHAMGNPLLWWSSTIAIALLWIVVLERHRQIAQSSQLGIALYLVVNHAANWLPWATVSRCLFLYHYMSAAVFAFLAIAWLVERWLSSDRCPLRVLGISSAIAIALTFLFWLPVYLGLPLSNAGFQWRMWFDSWI